MRNMFSRTLQTTIIFLVVGGVMALALAIAFPVLMHLAFYKILRVPLPWGVLQSVVFP